MSNIRNKKKTCSREYLDYYWKYYEMQSNQRIQVCSIYFTLISGLLGGYITVWKMEIHWAKLAVLILILFVALTFMVMFLRITKLRDEMREKIKAVDETILPEEELRKRSQWKTNTFWIVIQFVAVIFTSVSQIVFLIVDKPE